MLGTAMKNRHAVCAVPSLSKHDNVSRALPACFDKTLLEE